MAVTLEPVLDDQQISHFLEKGYVRVRNCFPREQAREWTLDALNRLGADEDRPETWPEPMVSMPATRTVRIKDQAPRAWAAVCQLAGGEDRLSERGSMWSDTFRINFSMGANQPYVEPSAKVRGWHKDGQFFRHFLDSPEQGMLGVVCWWDIKPRSGATLIAPDSIGVVARFMAEHPEGVAPFEFPYAELLAQCTQFEEAIGDAGDVYLLHPYMLHSTSQNPSGRPRFMTNPCFTFREPLNFDREDPADFSPIEQAVLRGLGVDRYAFKPTRERLQNEDGSPLRT